MSPGASRLVLKRRDAGTDRGNDDEAWPLCTGLGAELNLGDRVLGEVGKYNFIALPSKGGHSSSCPQNYVSQPGGIW